MFLLPDTDDKVIEYLSDLQYLRQKEAAKDAENPPEKNPAWMALHMSCAEKRAWAAPF